MQPTKIEEMTDLQRVQLSMDLHKLLSDTVQKFFDEKDGGMVDGAIMLEAAAALAGRAIGNAPPHMHAPLLTSYVQKLSRHAGIRVAMDQGPTGPKPPLLNS